MASSQGSYGGPNLKGTTDEGIGFELQHRGANTMLQVNMPEVLSCRAGPPGGQQGDAGLAVFY